MFPRTRKHFMARTIKDIKIATNYITLGQFLKIAEIIQTGGEAKSFLMLNDPLVNGEIDKRRGRKLYSGDEIVVCDKAYRII